MTAELRALAEEAAERVMAAWSADHEHFWSREQQTGHRVCAWCNRCDGGCATRPVLTPAEGGSSEEVHQEGNAE